MQINIFRPPLISAVRSCARPGDAIIYYLNLGTALCNFSDSVSRMFVFLSLPNTSGFPIWKKTYSFQFYLEKDGTCFFLISLLTYFIANGKYDSMSWLGVKNKLLYGFCTIKLLIELGK
jgi:hypothetical protein